MRILGLKPGMKAADIMTGSGYWAEIMADAAHVILTRPAKTCTGNFFIDDEVLASAGITDLSPYRHDGVQEKNLVPDFFV